MPAKPKSPASSADVARFILEKLGPMSAMKLQKLVYYCQAWSLVWDERPLFPEKIKAWANGPVVTSLYGQHKGKFEVRAADISGDASNLDGMGRDTVLGVIRFYGDKSAQWLSELTHQEAPWKNARAGLKPGERGNAEIKLSSMAEYYGSL